MKISRIIYAVLVILLAWAYFQPWTVMNGQSFPGWATVLPFSFFYLVGFVMAAIIVLTGYRAVGLSIVAGILMFGSNLFAGIFFGLIAAANHSQLGSGFSYAFFLSLLFMFLGPICGSGFDKTSNVKIRGEGAGSKLFWGVGMAVIVALVLHYVFHIG